MTTVFQYRGSKMKIAHEIWRRLGDVDVYCEPFFGRGDCLFRRPSDHKRRVEVVGDISGTLTNFFRAVKFSHVKLAESLNFETLNELDVLTRDSWLRANRLALEKLLRSHPSAFDLDAAAWWVYCQCLLYDTGTTRGDRQQVIVSWSADMMGLRDKRPFLHQLAERLVGVRIQFGNWDRTIRATPPGKSTGFMLDPPYSQDSGRKMGMYLHDDGLIAKEAAHWARKVGNDPTVRIAFCGFEGEHEFPGWSVLPWGTAKSRYENRGRERIWFSPHCLKPNLNDEGSVSAGCPKPLQGDEGSAGSLAV